MLHKLYSLLLLTLLVTQASVAQTNIYLTNGNKGTGDGSSFANGKDATAYLDNLTNTGTSPAAGTNIYITGGVNYTMPSWGAKSLIFNNTNVLLKGGFNPNPPYNYNPVQYITTLTGSSYNNVEYGAITTTTSNTKTVTIQGITFVRGYTQNRLFGNNIGLGGTTTPAGNFTFKDITINDQDGDAALFATDRFLGNQSSLTLDNVFITQTHTTSADPALISAQGHYDKIPISILNSAFTYNSNEGDEAAVFNIEGDATLTIANSYFCNNTAYNHGVGIVEHYNATVSISGCTFYSNTATNGYGAALNFRKHSTATISNCNFYNNHASASGGAIASYAGDEGTVNISNSIFYGNYVDVVPYGWGGAIATSETNGSGGGKAEYTLTNCKFVNNHSDVGSSYGIRGGAIYHDNSNKSMTIDGCLFYNNRQNGSTTANGADILTQRNDNSLKTNFTGAQSTVQNASGSYVSYLGGSSASPYNFAVTPVYNNQPPSGNDGGVTAFTGSCPTAINAVAVNVTGQVWDDVNGNVALDGSETGTNAGGPLYVNLVDATGTVVASTTVSATGSYTLSAPTNVTGYKLILTNSATASTPGALPTGWVNTGESVDPGNTASQSTTLGQIELTTGSSPIAAQNFGIEHLPTPGSGSNTVPNGGGTSPVTVPANTFTNSTPANDNGDTPPGSVTAIKLTVFPSNVTSLTINGSVYTSLPVGGITIPTDGNGATTVPILIDPTNDTQPVVFTYTALDNAGKASTTTGTATLNFTGVPDLAPIIYALPATQYGTTPTTVVVDVFELNNVATTGLITVAISKDPLVNLTFSPTASVVGGRPVNNNIWTFDNTNANFYLFTTSQVIGGGDVKSIGMTGVTTPGNTQGVLTISATIVGGSGGENRIDNNSDADKIDYFKK